MHCQSCTAPLSADEVAHSQAIQEALGAIPRDHLPPGRPRLPQCECCALRDAVQTIFLEGWSPLDTDALELMEAYATGVAGWERNPVMAYSWGLVVFEQLRFLTRGDKEQIMCHSAFNEVVRIMDEAQLSAEQIQQAYALAEEVYAISLARMAMAATDSPSAYAADWWYFLKRLNARQRPSTRA